MEWYTKERPEKRYFVFFEGEISVHRPKTTKMYRTRRQTPGIFPYICFRSPPGLPRAVLHIYGMIMLRQISPSYIFLQFPKNQAIYPWFCPVFFCFRDFHRQTPKFCWNLCILLSEISIYILNFLCYYLFGESCQWIWKRFPSFSSPWGLVNI